MRDKLLSYFEKLPFFFRGGLRTLSIALLLGAAGFLFLVFFLFQQVTEGLPDVKKLKVFRHSHATEVFAQGGKKIGEFTTERRYPVTFDSIPKHVVQAFISAEDASFYRHGGIDYLGMLRALISNFNRGKFAQGASTITQQVARGVVLSSREKKLIRKLREIVLAKRIERELTKNEILALYLSDIYLGHGSYGIGAGARNYFKKTVGELTLAEAAILAGLPQRPYDWDPFHNPAISKRRQAYVLKRMVDDKYITEAEAKAAYETPLRVYALEDFNLSSAPFFTEYVRQYLMNKYGSEKVLSEGYRVYTTLNFDLQKSAEQAVGKGLRVVDKRLGWRGVQKNIAEGEERQKFLEEYHQEIVQKLTKARILPVNVESGKKRLEFDLSAINRDLYFGETPVTEGEFYTAVVEKVDPTAKEVAATIGKTAILIPFSTLEWASLKESALIPSKLLKNGDIITVKLDKIDRRQNRVIASLEQDPEIQGALLSYELSNGHVRAMVGGTDFNRSKFNIALQARRQVGSTFKPVIYAAALDKGFSPSSIVSDSPIVFKFEGQLDADNQGETWRPHNYSGKFEGDIPLRLALIRSMNIPTVKLTNELTIDYVIQYARMLGITSDMNRDLSIALGSWSSSLEELSRAYAVFPRLGKPVQLVYIRRVEDADGKLLEDHAQDPVPAATLKNETLDPKLVEQGLVISPQTAYVMTEMLRGVVREGTGTAASVVPANIAGKTGTSNDHRDAWFIGYTPELMTGVWIGYEKDKPLDPAETGGKAAAPIWADYMLKAVPLFPKSEFEIPDDVSFAFIDRESGRLANASAARRVRVAFKTGTVPSPTGENIRRVGEPGGIRATATGENSNPIPPADVEDTGSYLREGYQ